MNHIIWHPTAPAPIPSLPTPAALLPACACETDETREATRAYYAQLASEARANGYDRTARLWDALAR